MRFIQFEFNIFGCNLLIGHFNCGYFSSLILLPRLKYILPEKIITTY